MPRLAPGEPDPPYVADHTAPGGFRLRDGPDDAPGGHGERLGATDPA